MEVYKPLYNLALDDDKEFFSAETKDELAHMVYHDAITGYYNWGYMWKRLLEQMENHSLVYGFVHFNIKDMKMLNDMYGHYEASNHLTKICLEMEKARKEGWVYHACRCDNDNFAMMIKAMPDEETIFRLAEFFEKVSHPDVNPEYTVYFRCGVVSAADAIVSDVRVADYAKFAQNLGRNSLRTDINFYTSEMYQKEVFGKNLIAYLDEAIAKKEIMVYYQPKYDIHTEKIVGAEALVRWNYKHEGLLPPSEFIPIFEDNNIIGKLDMEILKMVCANISNMLKMGIKTVPVSVNLSRIRLKNPHLKDHLIRVIDGYGVPHKYIEFELTESAAYNDDKAMVKLFNGLHEAGFKVSLDDFGTGYSSLSVLRKIPMDTLKIDKSFVDVINLENTDSREDLLLKDIIVMAKHLGYVCLAEGAEEEYQVKFLREAGCEIIQGYYYCKPLPEADFVEKLRNGE